MLLEQMQIMEDGGEPMNVFRDPARNDIIWLPFDRMDDEVIEGKTSTPRNPARHGEAMSTGSSGKFNTLNLEYAKRIGAPLPPPFPAPVRTAVEVSPG